MDHLMEVVHNPRQFVSNVVDMKLRDDLERLKKIRYKLLPLLFVFASYCLVIDR